MSSQCVMWDVRFDGDKELTKDIIIQKFNSIAKKWVFQKERGEKTGYVHFQCRISLIKKTTKKPLLKLFDDVVPNYLEPTAGDNYKNDNSFYVMKEQTRIDGPWKSTDAKPKFIPIQFRHITDLRPFQKSICNKEHYNYRCCNNLYDASGNLGKSVSAFFAYLNNNALYIPPMNDAQKIIEYIYCVLEPMADNQTPEIMVFDLPRSMSKDCLYGMYSAIEQIKTGFIYDTRYKGRSRWINCPDIWVFSNCLPDLSRLSSDRWKIWTINDKYELIKYCPPVDPIGDIIKTEIKIKKRLI